LNTYRYTFACACPANDEAIIYSLELCSRDRIMVEHIKIACALHKKTYHEDIAADLHKRFGGRLVLKANHHGVDIETTLDAGQPNV
jgi:hypothetical protein